MFFHILSGLMLLLVGSVTVDLYGFVDILFVMFRLAGSQLTWEGGDHIVATELFSLS